MIKLPRSASSEFFHFIRNKSSPLESVAPKIFSGSRPRSKPRFGDRSLKSASKSAVEVRSPPDADGPTAFFSKVVTFCLLFVISDNWSLGLRLLAVVPLDLLPFVRTCRSWKSAIRSGHSRFSSGSHVLSALK